MKNFALPLLIGIGIGIVGMGAITLSHDDFYWYRNTYNANVSSASIDAAFIENMIPHHQSAIDMATLALEKATTSEVRTLAQNIIDTQSEEITTMSAWYTTWFGTAVPQNEENNNEGQSYGMMHGGMMHGGMMDDEYSLSTLRNAKNFDVAFVEEMIPHHAMAVMMSEMLLRTTSREEMKSLAKNIIESQSAEIKDMQSWLEDWE